MKTLESKKIKLYSAEDGQYYSIDALHGESAFEIAQRLGFKGTEQEWMNRYVTEIETEGDEWLNKINTAGTNNTNRVQEVVEEAETQANAAKQNAAAANTAAQAANSAATAANDKANLADEKATLANEKANLANEKANLADTKASLAGTNATKAATNAALAETNAILAQNAADAANEAADTANEKAGLAEEKANLASQKANAAEAAANLANDKADLADEKAALAQDAADLANAAESAASNAATSATTAADAANKAAGRVDTAINTATTAAGAANLAATNANNAIAGLPEKVSEGIEQRISQITDALTPGNEYAAELVSARTDEDGQIHDSLKIRIDHNAKELRDTKAASIPMFSERAAVHELEAQESSLSVTLHGKTTETGNDEPKSPENPYTISGVDKAEVQAGNKNLYGGMYLAEDIAEKVPSAVIDTTAKTVKYTSTGISGVVLFDRFKPDTQYTIVITSSELSSANRPNLAVYYTDDTRPFVLGFTENAGTKRQLVYPTDSGRSVKRLVGYNNSATQFLLYEECGIFEGVLTAEDFEAFNANVIDLPLLPDGDPLMGDGTVDDIVENDVLSGCDKCVTINGTQSNSHLTVLTNTVRAGYRYIATDVATDPTSSTLGEEFYSDHFTPSTNWNADNEHFYIAADGQVFIWIDKSKLASVDYDGINAYLAANPLKVYYRSTEYTPEKDLRVTKVTRKRKLLEFNDASEFAIRNDNVSYYSVADFNAGSDGVTMSLARANQLCNVARIANASTETDPNWAWVYSQNGNAKVRISDSVYNYIANGGTMVITYPLAAHEVYMTDHHTLRKPYGIMPVTVAGSGETEVAYSHDTKSYIDSVGNRTSALEDAVTKALPTDTSLSYSGKAADAKVAGDHIRDLVTNVSYLKDARASSIVSTSPKAKSHELYIQPKSNIHTVMHGVSCTYANANDPSPTNRRYIAGISTPGLITGGKNLFSPSFGANRNSGGIRIQNNQDGTIHISVGSHSNYVTHSYTFPIQLPAGTYTLSVNNNKAVADSTMTKGILMWCRQIDGGYTTATFFNVANAKTVFTAALPFKTLVLRIGENVTGIEDLVIKPQLEFGSEATPFELYRPTFEQFPTDGESLHGNGEINDTVENDVMIDGARKCRITRRWKHLTMTGQEDWQSSDNTDENKYYYLDIGEPGSYIDSKDSLCSHLLFVEDGIKEDNSNIGFSHSISSDNTHRLYVRDNKNFPDLSSWTTFLTENYNKSTPSPVTFLLMLGEPEVTITDPVLVESSGLLPEKVIGSGETEVSYSYDTKFYVDSIGNRTSVLEDVVTEVLPDAKASAIIGTSQKAESHDLYIRPESDIHVMLYGETTQEGENDPSPGTPDDLKDPENIRPIRGVSDVEIRTGTKNLLSLDYNTGKGATGKMEWTFNDGVITINGAIPQENQTTGAQFYQFPEPLPPGEYTISANNNKSITNIEEQEDNVLIWCQNTNGKYIGTTYFSTPNAVKTFTTDVPITALVVRFGKNLWKHIETVDNLVIKPQIEHGGVATPFMPYKANSINLLQDEEPLFGHNDIFDTIENDVVVDGKHRCRITRRWKKLEFTGTENWTKIDAKEGGDIYYFVNLGNEKIYEFPSLSLCSHLKYEGRITSSNKHIGFRHFLSTGDTANYYRIVVRPNLTNFPKVSDWTNYLIAQHAAGTPVTFLLAKTEPEVILTDPIPLEAAGLMPEEVRSSSEIAVEYKYDTKHYIDQIKARTSALEDTVTKALPADTSLSYSGKAADAKIVGDRLIIVENDVGSLKNTAADIKRLPEGYAELEYLESTAEQSIISNPATNKLNQNSRVVIKFAQTDAAIEAGVNNYLFGSRKTTSENAFYATVLSTGQLEIGYGGYRPTGAYIFDTDIHVLDFNRQDIYLDGNLVYTAPEATFETPTNSRLFAIRGSNSSNYYYGRHKIFAYKEYANDVLISDMVPCVRLSDGVYGMYDFVHDYFSVNEKSGVFIPGEKVNLVMINNRITDQQMDVQKAQNDINEINAKLNGKSYVDAEADRVAEKVRQVQTGDSITFVAVSDMHYSVDDVTVRNALADMRDGIKAIASQTKLDFYASFGDVIYRLSSDGDYDKGNAEMIGITKLLNDAFGITPQIRMVGNHDPNAEGDSGYFSVDHLNAFTGAYSNMLTKAEGLRKHGYGYHDFDVQKVRVIVLNTSYYYETPVQGQTQYLFGYDQGYQLCQWLDLSDKGDAADWQIVVMSHIALDSTTKSSQIGKYSAILNAYIAGSSWSGGDYSYNFAGKNSAHLVLYINGHYHAYKVKNMLNVDSSGDVLNTLPMANLYIVNALPGREEVSLFDTTYTKTANTAESTAFQIVTLDPVSKTVYAHHYGAGIDIIMHYNPTTATSMATNLTDPVWASVDNSIATVADGVVTPVSAGNVMIMAKSETDNCIECWNYTSA